MERSTRFVDDVAFDRASAQCQIDFRMKKRAQVIITYAAKWISSLIANVCGGLLLIEVQAHIHTSVMALARLGKRLIDQFCFDSLSLSLCPPPPSALYRVTISSRETDVEKID